MNRSLLLFIFGVLHVMGLRKFPGENCIKVVFVLDVSQSIRISDENQGYNTTGFLPEIKEGVRLFAVDLECTCVEIQIITFATKTERFTTKYENVSAILGPLSQVDYYISPVCDRLENYINLTGFNASEPLYQQCLNNQSFFDEQALLFNNLCGRSICEFFNQDGFCAPFPRCGFTNFQTAFQTAGSLDPNYVIIITDGDPTIKNTDLFNDPLYSACNVAPYTNCSASFCPSKSDCSDVEDREAGFNAAESLKNNQGIKIIAVSRQSVISPLGVAGLLELASCPDDGDNNCTNATKFGRTVFIAQNYSTGLASIIQNIPRLAICNTASPTTTSPTRGPTNSPTFIVSEAPSPSACCNCAPSQQQVQTTPSPTPGRCIPGLCPSTCTCLNASFTGPVDFVLDDICFNRTCLDICLNGSVFNPRNDSTLSPTTRAPTIRRNILIWLLPYLLGLSGRGGAGGLRPIQGPGTTVIDVFNVIHGSGGRRLLATRCPSGTPVNCPNPRTYRCLDGLCDLLPVCTADGDCSSTTYCDVEFSVCRARALSGQSCLGRPCIQNLFCLGNPASDVEPRCASESCVRCCPCGGLQEGQTCAPTPVLAPGIVFNTRSPTTRAPSRRINFNPWLLLFLFPQFGGGGGGRFPIFQPRPGQTTVVDIWHIIHARQALFNATADNKECILVQVNYKWDEPSTGNGVNINQPCDMLVSSQAQCCAMCKEAPGCKAWELDRRPVSESSCPTNGNANLFPCRMIANDPANPSNLFHSSQYAPATGFTIGFISVRPPEPQFCNTTAECWNPGADETDEGDGRQICSNLGGQAPLQCRTICSADNACVRAQDIDTCYRQNIPPGGPLTEFGVCIAGSTRCLCDPTVCNVVLGIRDPRCCDVPDLPGVTGLVCCPGTGPLP